MTVRDLRQLQHQLESQRQKIDVDHLDVTVRELIRMSVEGELLRAPVYQRKFRWDEGLESRLVESLLLGLPVPSVFVATNRDGTWEIVDGLQRISTLLHFASEDELILESVGKSSFLALHDLDKLSQFEGLDYTSLPAPVQLAFMKRTLRVTALSDKSDLEARFDMFERLNTGGVALTAQEVRACIYRSDFNDLIRDLAESETFQRLVKLQKRRQQDGTREELVLKFFAYLDNRERFDGRVTDFLNDYMATAIDEGRDLDNARRLFTEVVTALNTILDGQPMLRTGVAVTPQNQLEAVMVAAGEILQEGGALKRPHVAWLDDEELVDASTGGTNTRSMLERRIKRARELLAA